MWGFCVAETGMSSNSDASKVPRLEALNIAVAMLAETFVGGRTLCQEVY